jgi:hypothetical protein
VKQIIEPFCHSERSRGISYCSEISRDASTPLDMTAENAEVVSYLRLRFDRDFGLHRISNETLLVRGMIHLLEFLLSRLFFAGELQSLV